MSTTRLIVQHPTLAESVISALSADLGAVPAHRSAALAVWTLSASAAPDRAWVSDRAARYGVDAVVQPMARLADYRLIAFDMDSTVITIECIDEIAEFAGCKPAVAAITAAAMRGEIADYEDSLRRRVALLAGLSESVLARVYEERLGLTPGIETLLTHTRRHGLQSLLVSGGFTYFTDRLKTRLGFDHSRSNRLETDAQGRLTGRLTGPIVGPQAKREIVAATCAAIGCDPTQAIVVGDGANDLLMMGIAGMSVAFHAKPVVQAAATHAVNHGGLDSIVNFFED